MHTEYYEVSKEAEETINRGKREGKKIIAVGTTSVRTLETVADEKGFVKAGSGNTKIFIYPGYTFKCVDKIITNFHLPESTLIMLVSAFLGKDKTLKAYNYAVKNGLISEKILLDENEENLKNMWYQLYSDVDFNIKMGTLNLLYCDWQKNSSYKSYKYDTDESNIKRILERYNGEGKDAIEYAERNYGLYKIFEKYNEAMRAIS